MSDFENKLRVPAVTSYKLPKGSSQPSPLMSPTVANTKSFGRGFGGAKLMLCAAALIAELVKQREKASVKNIFLELMQLPR
jgi:hypothetical protein